jgi:hypothetical protein
MTDIEIAKEILKLEDYIPGKKTKKGNYIFVEPCPICGHSGHFVISNGKFASFSGCIPQGDIIDWFVYNDAIPLKKAINKALIESGVKYDFNNEKIQERKLINQKYEKIEYNFNMVYNNLCFIFKTIKKIKNIGGELNELGIFLYNFSDFWTDEMIHSDNKDKTLKSLKENFITEINYFLKTCK